MRQRKLREREGCLRSNGMEHTACSEWRAEASAKGGGGGGGGCV